MATVNPIGLPKDSPFRNIDRMLLPKEPTIKAQGKEKGEDINDEEEGAKSSESRELS